MGPGPLDPANQSVTPAVREAGYGTAYFRQWQFGEDNVDELGWGVTGNVHRTPNGPDGLETDDRTTRRTREYLRGAGDPFSATASLNLPHPPFFEDDALADHGDVLGGHGLLKKGVVACDEILRAPLIVDVPGRESAREAVPDRLSLAGVPGGLLDAAGLDYGRFDGGSFLDALDRVAPPPDERVSFEHRYAYWGGHPYRACGPATGSTAST